MNKINIAIPEGFEIDQQKSDLSKGIIEFKAADKKKLSYSDIAEKLFSGKQGFYLTENGRSVSTKFNKTALDANNATSKEQLECLMAYNKLRNVAEYLNSDFIFNKESDNTAKWYIYCSGVIKELGVAVCYSSISSDVYFASKQLAFDAIDILGEEEIKKALFIY